LAAHFYHLGKVCRLKRRYQWTPGKPAPGEIASQAAQFHRKSFEIKSLRLKNRLFAAFFAVSSLAIYI
jgi:hypothetical protein